MNVLNHERFIKQIAESLVGQHADLAVLKRDAEEFANYPSHQKSAQFWAEQTAVSERLFYAERQYSSLMGEMRELVEDVEPGQFDALVQMHETGLVDFAGMVEAMVAAVLERPVTDTANLPTEGLE